MNQIKKKIYFISTQGVFYSKYYYSKIIFENDPLNYFEGLNNYYKTKWVAEKLISEARKQGLKCITFRLGILEYSNKNLVESIS